MNCVPKSISPCLETLKAVDGCILHLSWHQMRYDRTRKSLYNATTPHDLATLLLPPEKGTYRIRIVYTDEILNVEYIPHVERDIKRFALVESSLEYSYKYADRKGIEALFLPEVDDVIIMQEGKLKDTSIANIALLIDDIWLTPQKPLLEGTTRARLLAEGFLKEAVLDKRSLQSASKFAIMNALIGFKIIENKLIEGL